MKTIAIFLSILFAMAAVAHTQDRSAADLSPYTIKVDVALALFNVTVLDNKDHKVSGLGPENFRIYEEGQAEPISFFRADDVPATIGLVIDNSGSMSPRKDRVVAAATTFATACNPQDELFIVNFNERVSMGLPDSVDFTSDI